MTRFAIDTSVAVPLLARRHPQHERVIGWAAEHDLHLSGHAEVETFSVLTRLPDPFRLDAPAVAALLATGLDPTVHPVRPETLVQRIADAGVAGGAVYDALVAVAAADAGLALATVDRRAVPTYARIGVRIELVG